MYCYSGKIRGHKYIYLRVSGILVQCDYNYYFKQCGKYQISSLHLLVTMGSQWTNDLHLVVYVFVFVCALHVQRYHKGTAVRRYTKVAKVHF